jgi:hypothetical protein
MYHSVSTAERRGESRRQQHVPGKGAFGKKGSSWHNDREALFIAYVDLIFETLP